MEERTNSPTAVKVEEHSQYVILTYFHGDTNSMVDAHFSRALSKMCKAKSPAVKPKKARKPIKLEDASSCQSRVADPYSEPQPLAGHLLTFNSAENSPNSWNSFPARTAENATVPSLTYSLSQEGLSLTGQQYASSLLNLLHSDRGEIGPGVASCSKPELLPGWTVTPGFRESVDPAVSYEPDRRLEKKDLYWY
ncbi:transcription cofactor vestigial-like protein 1 [Salarias fasciatus]|uniref:transcription cofactor vestigial-like protein 1 n=1 Tax=Salarias fasciatus TaxID=181472 RepID=UPI001176AD0C|nr:transcription cofactor vestigial-like protein 1 [Salarias fasciatus]